jgi:hypothetical protein
MLWIKIKINHGPPKWMRNEVTDQPFGQRRPDIEKFPPLALLASGDKTPIDDTNQP